MPCKFEKVGGLPHDHYIAYPTDLVTQLNERSADRRKADPKFQKLDDQIKKYLDRKARHSISLNEAKFRAEYVPDDPEEKAADEKAKEGTQEEEIRRARDLGLGLLQRRGDPDRHRLPDTRLEGPCCRARTGQGG